MTNGQKMKVLQDITIITDTREKKNQHILDYLSSNNIPYTVEKLTSGDYSFYLPNYSHLNLDKSVIVERKNSLSELAGNFTSGRERFAREFERADGGQAIHLVVETATFKKLFNGTYRSSFTPNAFIASLLTWCIRYNIKCWFAETKESPELIYKIMYYELNEKLNNLSIK